MRKGYLFIYKAVWFPILLSLFLSISAYTYGADPYPVHILRNTDYGILHEIPLIDSIWLFYPGETPKEAQPDFSNWVKINHTDFGKTDAPKGWQGAGWFSTWVKADKSVQGKKLALRINHDGASEIFIDGKPVGGYGKIGNSAGEMKAERGLRELIPLWLNDDQPHLIKIHYTNFIGVYPDFLGFQVWIGDYPARVALLRSSGQLFSFVPIFAAAEIILGLLLLLFFFFYPKQKLNLYVAAFVLLVGTNGIAVYFYYMTSYPSVQYFAELMTCIFKVLLMWSGVILLYILDYHHIPRLRLIAVTVLSTFYLTYYLLKFAGYITGFGQDYFSAIFFLCLTDSFYSAYHLIKKRQKGVWLILCGVVSVTLVYFFAWADVFDLWPYQLNAMRVFVMSAGNLVLPFCLSLYLALDFARTNQELSAKLTMVEDLSAKALAQEAEKSALIAAEAHRLEELVWLRTAELNEKAAKLQEMDAVKSRFFTNITHEFKTPLTLIINPVKELLRKPVNNDTDHLHLILNNATRLLELINQLLDLSKLENRAMEINAIPFDLVAMIKTHLRSYHSVSLQKAITLNFQFKEDEFWVHGDKDIWDKIILNLISNAIKFTDKGAITITITNADDNVLLTIHDTGRGIPSAKLPYIFNRFYQADPFDTRLAGGTGIGLAIVKELVDLLGGSIRVNSREGAFTEFKLCLPYQPAVVSADLLPEITSSIPYNFPGSASLLPETDDSSPLILLVEDHTELRSFMIGLLSEKYRILSAPEGKSGMLLAQEHIPNLIITDIMMPEVDGYELSQLLKADTRTSHIPVIMLTAKDDMDSRIQGIESGADAYLGKPFDQRELFALIENLVNTREQLRERYSTGDTWFSESLSMPSIEQKFLNRVRDVVEAHINEEGYSADELSLDLGLSRTQLYRKLKAITGQGPGELIRLIRLRYAHDLLERQIATVAEVAYMVGFSSPASFSSSFSRHFGFPPSKVAEA